jgi:YesN/AraC family two-component response regulator
MNIVCVDDHPILLKGLEKNIHQIMPEASIHTFESADKALDFVKDGSCDILISEIEMQGMSGLTLARNIKNLNPEVNIIFLTVCDESEYAREVFDIRPSGYLLKPADEAQLAFELKNLRYRAD